MLNGKRVLITGASSGLGRHFATVLAAQGAELILAARRVERLQELAASLPAPAQCVALDVTDAASRAALVEKIDRLDVLVNNAGLARESMADVQTQADWDVVMNTNLTSMFFLTQALLPALQKDGGASVVNVASILGLRQSKGVVSYAVSKAGVVQLTKTLALEWARFQVRVNALAPGYFQTEINADFWQTERGRAAFQRVPMRRIGELSDLDGPLLLLCSDASRYMTGAVLPVDGGHLVSSL